MTERKTGLLFVCIGLKVTIALCCYLCDLYWLRSQDMKKTHRFLKNMNPKKQLKTFTLFHPLTGLLSVIPLLLSSYSFADDIITIPEWKKKYTPASEDWKKTKQHFVFNNGTEPESLDPALITGVPESRIVGALFEGLVDLDPETLEPRPGMARDWDISKDRLRYTFRLRQDAKWSDGTPITANDFHSSWERVLNPATGAAYAYQLFPIMGAQEYCSGKLKSFNDVGIKVVDQRTLVVTLKDPCNYFLDLVAFHTLFPVRTDLIKNKGDRWVRPENIICNGAYKLKSWKPRQYIELVKNPHYWDSSFCKLNKVKILPYDDLDTAYKLFLRDKIHWLPGLPLAKLDEIKRNPDYYVMPYLATYFYRFNVTKPPFNDARVRKALSMAIDRKIITDHILKGGQQPATWFCPPVAGYKPVKGLAYNKKAAKKLLSDAGYGSGGIPFPPVEILYNTSESHKVIAEAIAQQWKMNLGIKTALRNTEWKVLLNEMDSLNYQIIRSSWIGDYADPNTFFDMFVRDGGNNRTGWSNSRYDELLKQTQIEKDHERRLKLFREMEQILVEEEFPILPLYIYVNQGLLAEKVHGWHENIRDIHPLKYIWLEE